MVRHKTFLISDEIVAGVVRSEYDTRISFDKAEQTVELIAYSGHTEIKFTELEEYAACLNALIFALRDDIKQAIEEEQDNSLPE